MFVGEMLRVSLYRLNFMAERSAVVVKEGRKFKLDNSAISWLKVGDR